MNENGGSCSCYVWCLLRRFPLTSIPHSRAHCIIALGVLSECVCIADGKIGFLSDIKSILQVGDDLIVSVKWLFSEQVCAIFVLWTFIDRVVDVV
jgi:hypothetical protein